MVAIVQREAGSYAEYWTAFMSREGLPDPKFSLPDRALLEQIVRAFSHIPYENATQLLMVHRSRPRPRRPAQLITEHLAQNSGGTCYDLAYSLAELLRIYGFTAEIHRGWVGPATRDERNIRLGNHAAVIVRLGRDRFLCDPGMILQAPVPVGSKPYIVEHARESPVLSELDFDGRLHLMIRGPKGFTDLCRLDPKPLSEAEVEEMWSASFNPILPAEHLFLNRVMNGELWSLADIFLSRRDSTGRVTVSEPSWQAIAAMFQMPPTLLIDAWRCTPHSSSSAQLKRKVRRWLADGANYVRAKVAYFP